MLLSPTHFTSSNPFGHSKQRPDWLAQRKPKLEHTGARTPKDPRSRRSTDNKANLISPSRLYLGLCCCYMFVYIYTVYQQYCLCAIDPLRPTNAIPDSVKMSMALPVCWMSKLTPAKFALRRARVTCPHPEKNSQKRQTLTCNAKHCIYTYIYICILDM